VSAPRDVRDIAAEELAWIAAVPCALLTLAAVVVLGPVLAHALLMPTGKELWPFIRADPRPVSPARCC